MGKVISLAGWLEGVRQGAPSEGTRPLWERLEAMGVALADFPSDGTVEASFAASLLIELSNMLSLALRRDDARLKLMGDFLDYQRSVRDVLYALHFGEVERAQEILLGLISKKTPTLP